MLKVNILFTAVGRRVSLIKHFQKALSELDLEGEIFAADAGLSAPASFVTENFHLIPRVSDTDYISSLLKLCEEKEIDLLVSLIDTDLVLLSQHRNEFEELGTRLLVSDEATNTICFDKNSTYQFFCENNIPTPKVYSNNEIEHLDSAAFPLLLKPWDGSCSLGVHKIYNHNELDFFMDYVNNAMLQEYIEGDEYTCDVYVDFSGKVRCVVPRKRLETRGGEVSKGLTTRNHAIIQAVTDVVNKLPNAIGCITVQCFLKESGEIKFIEINPRFGGGIPLSLHAGANFPKWIYQEIAEIPCEASMDCWKDDLAMLRFDDEIIVSGDKIR